jgi:signal peptidase I
MRRAGCFAAWLLGGFAATVLVTVLASLLLGQRVVIVLSGSMEPGLSTGDVLIERPLSPAEVEVGDVITFEEPGGGRRITHRVRDIEVRGERIVFTTKGDANNTTERWAIASDGELYTPKRRIPLVGHLAILAKTPLGLLMLIVAPLLALATIELRSIWRRPDLEKAETDAAPA